MYISKNKLHFCSFFVRVLFELCIFVHFYEIIKNMKRLSDERLQTLVKVATYYYKDGLTQNEISKKMNISRPNISRLLDLALSLGIVSIQINDPFAKEDGFLNWFKEHFDLLSVSLIEWTDDSYATTENIVDALVSELQANVKKGANVSIMAGLTINTISRYMKPIKQTDITYIPMVGGFGSKANWQANLNARNFGERTKSKYLQLNAPYIVQSKEAYDILVLEPEIKEVLDMAKSSSVAIVGIGQMQRNSTLVSSGLLSKEELKELHDKGVVGSIGTSFIDADGNEIPFSKGGQIIGITSNDLKKIPRVIGIAFGKHKIKAITAALIGKWIDILITDKETAKAIQDYYLETKNKDLQQ